MSSLVFRLPFYLRTCCCMWKWACQAEKFSVIHPFILSVWDSCTLSPQKFLPILFFVFLINSLSVFSTLTLFGTLCSILALCPLLSPFSSIHHLLYQQKSFPLSLTDLLIQNGTLIKGCSLLRNWSPCTIEIILMHLMIKIIYFFTCIPHISISIFFISKALSQNTWIWLLQNIQHRQCSAEPQVKQVCIVWSTYRSGICLRDSVEVSVLCCHWKAQFYT